MAGPIPITREELYRRVWQTPMSTLATEFGISDSGLLKLCKRLDVPCPPRGYWARQRAGRRIAPTPLPPSGPSTPAAITIRPTLTQSRSRPIVKKIREAAAGDETIVPNELRDPHPLIRAWLANRTQRSLSNEDMRRFRILDTIFRALDRHDLAPQAEGDEFYFTFKGEKVACALETVSRSLRRPSMERLRSNPDLTSILRFTIKNYFPPMYAIRRQWSDSIAQRLEAKVGNIVQALLAAGPLLVRARGDRAEQQRRWAQQRRENQSEMEQRLLEGARLEAVLTQANLNRSVLAALIFLDDLESRAMDMDATIQGKTLKQWLDWARQAIRRADPLERGAAAVFEDVARAIPRK
jgi:hypothetical protein